MRWGSRRPGWRWARHRVHVSVRIQFRLVHRLLHRVLPPAELAWTGFQLLRIAERFRSDGPTFQTVAPVVRIAVGRTLTSSCSHPDGETRRSLVPSGTRRRSIRDGRA